MECVLSLFSRIAIRANGITPLRGFLPRRWEPQRLTDVDSPAEGPSDVGRGFRFPQYLTGSASWLAATAGRFGCCRRARSPSIVTSSKPASFRLDALYWSGFIPAVLGLESPGFRRAGGHARRCSVRSAQAKSTPDFSNFEVGFANSAYLAGRAVLGASALAG